MISIRRLRQNRFQYVLLDIRYDQSPYNSVQVMRIIRYIVKQTMETKVVPKFAIFPIFYNGKRRKIVTKNGITLLILDIFSKFKMHDELDAILREINVI